MSYQDVAELIGRLKKEGKTPNEAAHILVQESIERGSLDNVTAVVIYLPPQVLDLFCH